MPLHLSLPQSSPHDSAPYERTPEEISARLAALPAGEPVDTARAIVEMLAEINRARVRRLARGARRRAGIRG
jgi:hypothetical protein